MMNYRGVYTATFAMVALVLIFSSIILMSISVRDIEIESKTDTILELQFIAENAIYLADQAVSDGIADYLYTNGSTDCDPSVENFLGAVVSKLDIVMSRIFDETGVTCNYFLLENNVAALPIELPTGTLSANSPPIPTNYFNYRITCETILGSEKISVSKMGRTGKMVTDPNVDATPLCIGVDICDIYSGICDIRDGAIAGCTC
ncbi:MAG: hypothetical protein ABID38_00830 [Candidatus Diapherotrites archaeon]